MCDATKICATTDDNKALLQGQIYVWLHFRFEIRFPRYTDLILRRVFVLFLGEDLWNFITQLKTFIVITVVVLQVCVCIFIKIICENHLLLSAAVNVPHTSDWVIVRLSSLCPLAVAWFSASKVTRNVIPQKLCNAINALKSAGFRIRTYNNGG